MNTIVVVGGGIAGITCIQTILDRVPDQKIILITSSNYVKIVSNIQKFGIDLELFDVEIKSVNHFKTNFPNVEIIIARVISLDTNTKEIFLNNNTNLNYDKLCICTGAVPKTLDFDNIFEFTKEELCKYIHVIRDTETVKNLQDKLNKYKKIVIVGNGGIATELIYCVKFCKLIWVIKDGNITSNFLDPGASHFLNKHIFSKKNQNTTFSKCLKYSLNDENIFSKESDYKWFGCALGPDWQNQIQFKGENHIEKDIQIEYFCSIKKLFKFNQLNEQQKTILLNENGLFKQEKNNEKNVWSIYVKLSNNKLIGCDLILNATGVKPNTQILNNEHLNKFVQLAVDGGLLVDDKMRTNLKDVFAAGDVCSVFINDCIVDSWLNDLTQEKFNKNKIITQSWHQIRLWTQAKQMGYYAGHCILDSYDLNTFENCKLYSCFDLFTHMTTFFGFKIILIGLFNGQFLNNDYEVIIHVEENLKYIKLIIQDNILRGCILIGETNLEETFENLIRNQLNIENIKDNLLDDIVDIEDYFD